MSKMQTLRGMATVSFFANDVKTQETVMTATPQLKGPFRIFHPLKKLTACQYLTGWEY